MRRRKCGLMWVTRKHGNVMFVIMGVENRLRLMFGLVLVNALFVR